MATCIGRRALRQQWLLKYSVRPPSHLRAYQSSAHPPSPPFTPEVAKILARALEQVPEHGFTETALAAGARDAGFLDVSKNLLPRGVYEIINYHLVTSRLGLKDAVRFPGETQTSRSMGIGEKVRALLLRRLRDNAEANIVGRWQEALAIMAMPSNVSPSLKELLRLSDEIWFLVGDTSVDTSWYTKRASLASVYAAAEVYQSQDQSTDFRDTERFVDARLQEVQYLGTTVGAVGEWLSFTRHAAVNVLRSKGMRI